MQVIVAAEFQGSLCKDISLESALLLHRLYRNKTLLESFTTISEPVAASVEARQSTAAKRGR